MGDGSGMTCSLRPVLARLAGALACAAFLAPALTQAQNKADAAKSKSRQAQMKAADAPLKQGNAFREQGEYDKAIEKYSEVIKVAPDLFQAWANRGSTRVELGASKLEMKNDPAALAQGAEFVKLGGEDFDMALKLAPKDRAIEVRNNRASSFSRAGNFDVAFADYEILIKDDPKNLKTYIFNRGVAYLDRASAVRDKVRLEKRSLDAGITAAKADFDLAMADFTEALKLDPKMTVAYLNRGTCYTRILEYEKAVEDYSKAIQLDPANKRAYRSRGEVNKALSEGLRQMGDKDKAAELKALSDKDFAKYEELTKLPPGAAGGTALPVAPVGGAKPAASPAVAPAPAPTPTPAAAIPAK